MNKIKFKISGGDDGCYGPAFVPVIAEEIGEVMDSASNVFLALHLEEAIMNNGIAINHLIVKPRYTGDTIEKLKTQGATVGIAIVLPNMIENVLSDGMSNKNTEYWAVGDCIPITG
jgi:malate/lactate dehydrogenase